MIGSWLSRSCNKYLKLGLDAIDELCNDGGFIEHTDHEACLFTNASCEKILSLVTRLAHTLECSERAREHVVCGVVERQQIDGVGVIEDAIHAAPRPVEGHAQLREKVTLERADEEMLQDPQGCRFRYVAVVAGVFPCVQKVQDQYRIASCSLVCSYHAFDLLPYIGLPVGLLRIGVGDTSGNRPRVRTTGCVASAIGGDPRRAYSVTAYSAWRSATLYRNRRREAVAKSLVLRPRCRYWRRFRNRRCAVIQYRDRGGGMRSSGVFGSN